MEVKQMKKRKEIDLNLLSTELLKYAKENFSETMQFDTYRAKKFFGVNRNVIIEAYAFGPEELKEFKLVETKPANNVKDAQPPVVGKKGTIVIKKYYIDRFNADNPGKEYKENDLFDVKISADKIVLTKKN